MKGSSQSTQFGYTLVETLVAMVLLSGVLLLLVSSIGTMFFTNQSTLLQEALAHSISEMAIIENAPKEAMSGRTSIDHFDISRTIARDERMLTVLVNAILVETGDTLVTLHKAILLGNE